MAHAAIHIHPTALKEFWSALAWYKARSQGAAQRFRDEFKRLAKRMAATPEQGNPYRGAYRWMRMRRFPYLVYYKVADPTLVLILAIAHAPATRILVEAPLSIGIRNR